MVGHTESKATWRKNDQNDQEVQGHPEPSSESEASMLLETKPLNSECVGASD